MLPPFFPSPAFGWTFVAVLCGVLAVAAWIDARTLKIPRKLSMGLLAAGFVASVVRGVTLNTLGLTVWQFSDASLILALIDGLLFSVAGLLTGFAVFFVMWRLGIAGGGDVKIAAAVGAWIGPILFLVALLISTVALCAILVVRVFARIVSGRMPETNSASAGGPRRVRGPRLSYSLPLAIGTLVALVTATAIDLHLVARPTGNPSTTAPSR